MLSLPRLCSLEPVKRVFQFISNKFINLSINRKENQLPCDRTGLVTVTYLLVLIPLFIGLLSLMVQTKALGRGIT